MSKKVFVLGAGFNQFLKRNFDNYNIKVNVVKDLGFNYSRIYPKSETPPMSKNFFAYALTSQFYLGKSYYGINNKVLDYIEKLFNRSRDSLLYSNFDLELLFSFVEAQINDAKNKNDQIQLDYLEEIRLNLIIAIGDTFFDLEWQLPWEGRDLLEQFGQIIYQTKSDIITFNYDCLAEWAIEQASGQRIKTVEELKRGNTFFNWDRYSAYGIKFTRIRTGGWNGYYDGINGRNIAKKFYEKYYKNAPEFKFIKLHGSYNWYKYSNYRYNVNGNSSELARAGKLYIKSKNTPKSLEKEVLCFNGDWQFGILPAWNRNRFGTHYQYVLEPIIIPPILIKEHEHRKELFQQLWHLAKKSLLKCEEVVFMGYSFPDTDFYSKKLFIEVFSENKNITVTMVNPDGAIENKFRELVNFRGLIKRYVDSG